MDFEKIVKRIFVILLILDLLSYLTLNLNSIYAMPKSIIVNFLFMFLLFLRTEKARKILLALSTLYLLFCLTNIFARLVLFDTESLFFGMHKAIFNLGKIKTSKWILYLPLILNAILIFSIIKSNRNEG